MPQKMQLVNDASNTFTKTQEAKPLTILMYVKYVSKATKNCSKHQGQQ